MCTLLYENRFDIKKKLISLFTCFFPKFREPYHSKHVIPHCVIFSVSYFQVFISYDIEDI